MKDYYDSKKMKKTSYLWYGLVAAGAAGLTIVTGIISAIRGDGAAIIAISFLSGAAWAFTAVMSLYIFYSANRAVLNKDDLEQDKRQ